MTDLAVQARAFVLAQFLLIVVALVGCGRLPVASPPGIYLLVAGLLLGAWALLVNRPENINVNPLPREGAELCFTGPYQFVRHPMYLAVLATIAGFVLMNFCLVSFLAWIGLLVVLERKADLEEQLLKQRSVDYSAYCQRTKYRLIPLVY